MTFADKLAPGCNCCTANCALVVTSTEAGFCDSDTDFGVWTSGYGVDVPTPSITITNSDGSTISNGSNQPAGTYTAVSTVPTSLCATVGTTEACITYDGPVTTSIDHVCPDITHSVPSPSFAGWQVVLTSTSEAVSNDAGCGASVGPSGTGTVTGTGQTFSIPGMVVLDSDGDSLTISGTYVLTGSQCCNSNGPGSELFTDEYTINGTFSFPFCDGPCAGLTFGIGCFQRTIEDGGGVYITGSVISSYCTPTGTVVTGTTDLGDLGDPPYGDIVASQSLSESSTLPPFSQLASRDRSKIRVGFVSPCLVFGGAETWQLSLAKSLDERFDVVGVAVTTPIIDNDVVDSYKDICPVSDGRAAVENLARHCDILVTWGRCDYATAWCDRPSKPYLLSICHIPPEWDDGLYQNTANIDGFVAVSEAAKLVIPEALRKKSTVIPNAVDPSRLATTRTRNEALRQNSWVRDRKRKSL